MPKGVPRDKSVKRRILHRLRIAHGHLNRVIEMVEKDEYCVDVVHQSLAVQAALGKVDGVLLENHLKTCVVDSIRKGESKEVVDEILRVFEKKK